VSTLYFTLHPYPMGILALVAGDEGLEQIRFEGIPPSNAVLSDDHPVLKEAGRQLDAWFNRDLRDFDLPLVLKGTPFQILAWQALRQIPYGTTRSYTEQAKAIGAPAAVRAVGAANGRNPIPIVVPCHRVIGSNGKLTGFGGGLPVKRYLLDLESNPRLPL
jgi:methylated-DNA-[protein]-cysteine S-methyltransferase